MRGEITVTAVTKLPNGQFISDNEIQGFIARRLPSGKVSFSFQYTAPRGARRWLKLGLLGSVTVAEARKQAKVNAGLVAQGRDPAEEQKVETARSTNTVDHVLNEWLAKYARDPDSGNLRSADEIEAMFDRYVRPKLGNTVLYDLTLTGVQAMLDDVKAAVKAQSGGKQTGGTMANRVRAHLRSAFEWWRAGDEKFDTQPIPSKKRGKRETPRERALDQEEFRDFWRACDDLQGIEPAFWRCLFLSACRRNEIARMHLDEIDRNWNNWTIAAARYKTKVDHVIPLTPALKAVLPPKPNRGGFLFTTTSGERPLSGFSKFKPKLMRAINELRKAEGRGPIANFTPHDLRRTAKTFMGKARVPPDHSDRVLGHLQPGMRKTYDRHDYRDEKATAIETLAAYIQGIVHPQPPNVVDFPTSGRAPSAAPR